MRKLYYRLRELGVDELEFEVLWGILCHLDAELVIGDLWKG